MNTFAEQEPAYFYFAEQTSPDDNPISIDVHGNPYGGGIWWVEFDTCLHLFEYMNRNTRQYLGQNIWDCLQLDKIQSFLRNNGWYGEADHPYPMFEGQKLSEKRIKTIELSRVSHKIMSPRMEGTSRLMGHIQTDSGSVFGKDFANKIIQGLIPSFSCRCFGVMRLVNGRPTIIVRLVVTYDWVLYPGFEAAKMTSDPQLGSAPLPPSAKSSPLFESADIAIPINEIIVDVANKDDNIKAYMEAFDADISDISGFDGERMIIAPDRDHYIYPKMNKDSVNRVRDFYRSFNI